ncbi:MAG: CHAP domain-containing protein, partial [Myxococcaceae bacterium]
LVTLFQRAAGGLANGEPWCMAFVQFCIQAVDTLVADCEGSTQKSLLFKSEHCLCIWQQGQTASGHVGIVVDVNADGCFMAFEGNTRGDGVWLKRRCLGANGTLRLKGFLRVW